MNDTFKMCRRMLVAPICALGLLAALIAAGQSCSPFSRSERRIILNSDSLMYVTVIGEDSTVLRTPSPDLTPRELASPLLKTLTAKMIYTVRHPSQDGVGIAAPQVGINRRIICVQRFDKAGEPFECYLNLHLDSLCGTASLGAEGCLSVPPLRGSVRRYPRVVVSYLDPASLEPRKEAIEGYTAVIFQHECDHLDGVLYIDKADTLWISTSWVNERSAFQYDKPTWWPL